MDQQHEMLLENTHSSGAEEWYCPSCGRRFLMQWSPAYKKIVLEPGDEYAAHVGGVIEIPLESIDMSQPDEDEIPEESLRFWQKALEDMDLDDLGDNTNA